MEISPESFASSETGTFRGEKCGFPIENRAAVCYNVSSVSVS